MTALDDALDEASVTFGPHQIKAYWRESDLVDDGDANTDTPTDLTSQFKGDMVISHSISDGLPDPVTRTSGADASGILSAGLVGREGLVLSTSGYRAYDSGGGSWDTGAAQITITVPIPPGALRDDTLVAIVLVDDNTASLVQSLGDPKNHWEPIGSIADAPIKMWGFAKRRWRDNNEALVLSSDKPVDYLSVSMAFWARNPADMALDLRVPNPSFQNETVTQTTHTASGRLDNRGYFLTFWGSPSGNAWTAGAGQTAVGNQTSSGLTVLTTVTPLLDSGLYNLSSSQAVSNNNAVMAMIAIEPYERPKLDARQYFSPFNPDSPIYGWDRDNADVTAAIRTLTATGSVDTNMFDGIMQGIVIRGREAAMEAVSKARIWMNRSIRLPQVNAVRENATLDWLVTYLLARGGSFAGPAPNRYSRYWAPLYGSVHSHWDTIQSYHAAYYFHSGSPLLRFGLKRPQVILGPWLTAMYAQQSATRMEELWMYPRRMHQFSTDDFPHLFEDGAPGPLMMDLMSGTNSKGRVQFWVRADAATSAPGYLSAGDDFLVKGHIQVNQPVSMGNGCVGLVEFGIASNSRNPYLKMGSDATGYTSVSFVFSGLPTNGSWNFYGISWDYAAGTGNACFNGSVITASTWATNGDNDITGLMSTDLGGVARGDSYDVWVKSHIPISDIIMDAGETYVAGQWAEHYPTPMAPGANADIRPTHIVLNAIAEPTVVNAWDELALCAKSSMSQFRCDESDVIDFLPLQYFGEAAQMTSVAVQDTSKNAMDMDVKIDPSKTRNVVTVKFPDTRSDATQQILLAYLSAIELTRGLTEITFTLDYPAVEIHGQAVQGGVGWEIKNLTSSEISTPTLPKDRHYITVNTSSDGGGTVLDESKVTASIVVWDVSSITLLFNNRSGSTVYLANNGNQVPFLQILGYASRASDGYVTIRDEDSVAVRRERALETEVKWIHNRQAASVLALSMTNALSKPIAEVSVTVFGDPRRKPTDLVTLLDVDGTKVDGTWRVLSVEHETDGPAYTQNLTLIPVNPVGVWDDPAWDEVVWGE